MSLSQPLPPISVQTPDAAATHLDVPALARLLAAYFPGGPSGAPGLAGVIFDCDGVLLDSGPANIRYYNLLREGVGLPPMSPEQEVYVHMSTGPQAVEAIIPPALRPALRDVVRRIPYERDILPMMLPHEGLFGFLDACAARGLQLGVHTNRTSGMGELLRRYDLARYFDPVITSALAPPKPDPGGTRMIVGQWGLPPERLLFVGDSSTDREAAEGAGVPFLAFRTLGLSPAGACASFTDLTDALALLRG